MDPPPRPEWEPLPELIRPMLASPATALPSPQDRWAYEFKWDGVRATVYVDGGGPRVLSRSDRDVTASYPELRALAETQGARQIVLDGEIVALDDDGRPSFGVLQERMHVTKAAQVRRLMGTVPATYLIFDVLHLDGRSTLGLPYGERRDLLDSLELAGPSWATAPSFAGGGEAVLEASRRAGMEGVVAKRLNSPYTPGRRSDSWLKVKNLHTQEVLICGWKPGAGRRGNTFGSLLLGVPRDGGLDYIGHVGTGFSDAVLREIQSRLDRLAATASPFAVDVPREHARGAVWVRPELVGEVAYSELTRDGRLRHPSWRGLRPDKTPEDVRYEP